MKKLFTIKTKYGNQVIVVENDGKKGFIATGRDIEGVATWGRNLLEVKKMAKEAVELAIESLVLENLSAQKHPFDSHARQAA